jgi:N-acetylglutamate synthase-like GNAT family acetyltransferase
MKKRINTFQFCRKIDKTDWGVIYTYTNKCSGFVLYTYNDNSSVVYLSCIYVSPHKRNNGFGNNIMHIAEKEAKRMKFSSICLKVLKDSWKYKWYSDCGYKDLCVDKEDERYIWKVNNINKENDKRTKII